MTSVAPNFARYQFNDYWTYLSDESEEDYRIRIRKVLESCMDRNFTKTFLKLINTFIDQGEIPNLTLPELRIGRSRYQKVSCFKAVNVYWNSSERIIKAKKRADYEKINEKFEEVIDRLLIEQYRLVIASGSEKKQRKRISGIFNYCMRKELPKTFLNLINTFIDQGGDPNLTFPELWIESNTFKKVTCFQVVYLYWKNPVRKWRAKRRNDYKQIHESFKAVIDRMLDDRRTDLRAKFSEHFLSGDEHFFNEKQEAYPRQSEEEGYLLERATIAHYAMIIGDFEIVDKVLKRIPDLLHSTCCLMKGKNLFHQDGPVLDVFSKEKKKSLDWQNENFSSALIKIQELEDEETAGEVASVLVATEFVYPVTRITQVSLLHLAARWGDEIACGYFRGLKANFVARDSDQLTPVDYLQLSLSEKFISDNSNTKRLIKMLKPVEQLTQPFLPPKDILLTREGYHLLYDTRTKVAIYAYQRLTKESLVKNTGREAGGSFKIDHEVPSLNQGKSDDYTKSGYDKGHLVPAADATSSEKSMRDTFLFSNIAPQNPQLNRGFWKRFEGHVRELVSSHDLIEVFTGGLFMADKNTVSYPTIGQGQISVPTHFFKVLYLYKGLEIEEEAFIVPNKNIPGKTEYTKYETTIDAVQTASGILFKEWRQGH